MGSRAGVGCGVQDAKLCIAQFPTRLRPRGSIWQHPPVSLTEASGWAGPEGPRSAGTGQAPRSVSVGADPPRRLLQVGARLRGAGPFLRCRSLLANRVGSGNVSLGHLNPCFLESARFPEKVWVLAPRAGRLAAPLCGTRGPCIPTLRSRPGRAASAAVAAEVTQTAAAQYPRGLWREPDSADHPGIGLCPESLRVALLSGLGPSQEG